ncbi:DUF456 family protein [Fulvivirgaceae bacterium PWU4]|uniref:DUF456 family protein n=1 Tax=Chryseosolibacter histidini TaxID=2782349 RepID=A0AAP2DMH8_9BACT|nr:DUF456 domain-containing protein [Chryseosolibacter histidini]MBT1699075.1 DUF456 family protein [Chryseosolibacter histidini]
MDIFLLVLGSLLMLLGLAGCVLPFLPGPPLCYVALLIQQLQTDAPYTTRFLVIWAVVTVVVTLLDYVIPVYGTKKYGGTKYGMWGCVIGLIAGLWLGPVGIIVGPFAGAFIGELVANSSSEQALRAAFGSFLGFLVGTLLKLVACFVMVWYFVKAF